MGYGRRFYGDQDKLERMHVYLVNIYSFCSINKKRKTWKELIYLKLKFSVGDWCLARDFNSIKRNFERKGLHSVVNKYKIAGLSRFIEDIN